MEKRTKYAVLYPGRWRKVLFRALMVTVPAVLLLTAPVDWGQAGRALLLTAAAVQQPETAAAFFQQRLTQTAITDAGVSVSSAAGEAGTHTDAATVTVSSAPAVVTGTPPPAEDGTGGKVYEQQLDTGDVALDKVAVRNRSDTAVDIGAALDTALSCRFEKTDAPQVLIIHTHTTEDYLPYAAGYYNAADRRRTVDNPCSVRAVGAAVVQALAEEGIAAVQDTTVHDAPQYSGAYSRSADTVTKNLQQYPSIKVVLDIHRDAIMQGDTGLVKPTVTVGGQQAAQMMILVGVASTDALPNPHWKQNLALAAQWQKTITDRYHGLMRPLSTVTSRYNQHLHAGYLLVEVGSEGNSIDEAVYSGRLLGKTLATLLT